jgi:hypothetical protein
MIVVVLGTYLMMVGQKYSRKVNFFPKFETILRIKRKLVQFQRQNQETSSTLL